MKKAEIRKMIADIEKERSQLTFMGNADMEWRKILQSLQTLIHWYD